MSAVHFCKCICNPLSAHVFVSVSAATSSCGCACPANVFICMRTAAPAPCPYANAPYDYRRRSRISGHLPLSSFCVPYARLFCMRWFCFSISRSRVLFFWRTIPSVGVAASWQGASVLKSGFKSIWFHADQSEHSAPFILFDWRAPTQR